MKLVTYQASGETRTGVLTEDGVVDSGFATMRELLRAGPPQQPDGEAVQPERLLPPVTDPEKIICIGLNYLSHAREQGAEPPETPTIFGKYRNALVAPGATVQLPAYSSKVDYEAEVAFVIGRQAKDVPEADALDHVAGYMLLNDLSARDMQFATPQWMPGKIFDGAAPSGPWLVTPDEAGPHDAIEIRLTLNGEEMQNGSTADLVHSIPALVVYLSKLMTLEPGDIVSTGTPAGVGSLRDPRVWLGAGDEVVVESPTLGRLVTVLAT
jgi:2-keto-4-pentenoate hydratase/2-oxohepta-3-ene-1,7-dioic acid hydratase in catechol pathway